MLTLSSSQLVTLWERGLEQHPVDKALTLLSAVYPDMTRDELAALSVGQRDARLLAIHENLFGPSLKSVTECPQCAAPLEFALNVRELQSAVDATPSAPPSELASGDVWLRFRSLNSEDLALISSCPDVSTARRVLVDRCVLESQQAGSDVPVEELPEEIIEKLANRLGTIDSQADTLVELHCVACSHHWELMLDIVSFLWIEINVLAKRLLREVHRLAWAYGWRETDILAMSAVRRQFYLDMVE
jgi:hypothetical protein